MSRTEETITKSLSLHTLLFNLDRKMLQVHVEMNLDKAVLPKAFQIRQAQKPLGKDDTKTAKTQLKDADVYIEEEVNAEGEDDILSFSW